MGTAGQVVVQPGLAIVEAEDRHVIRVTPRARQIDVMLFQDIRVLGDEVDALDRGQATTALFREVLDADVG